MKTICGFRLPSRAHLLEFESSSRHDMDKGRVVLSTPFVTKDAELGVSVLIAGVFGMNVKGMPEYDGNYGYADARVLMLVTTLAPLIWFRMKTGF